MKKMICERKKKWKKREREREKEGERERERERLEEPDEKKLFVNEKEYKETREIEIEKI